MKTLVWCLTIAAVILTATGAVAQPPPPGPPPGPLEAYPLDPGASLEEKDTRELVETLLMVRLSRELALEKEQTVVMVQRVSETRDALQALRQERQALLSALRDSVQAGEDAAVIQENLQKMRQHDREMVETRQRSFDELAQGLTATQQARLYVFLEDFEGQMRQMAQQARRRGMQGGPDQQQMDQRPGGRQGMQDGSRQPMRPRPDRQGMQGGPGQQMGPPPGGQGMQGGPGQQMGPPPGGQGMQGGPGQQMGPPPGGQGMQPPPAPVGDPGQP